MGRKSAIVLDGRIERDQSPLAYRALVTWSLRRELEEMARAQMNHQDAEALEARNERVFGSALPTTMRGLIEDARRRGLDEEAQLKTVIHWAVRPDIYYVLPHPGAFGCTAPDVRCRNPIKPKTDEAKKALSAKVTWSHTADPLRPWTAAVARKQWEIQINDFPEEQLFTLFVNGGEKFSFDGWPKNWVR